MNKRIFSFLLICYITSVHCMQKDNRGFRPVTVDRSPSAFGSRKEFTKHIIEKICLTEQEFPNQGLVVDFQDKLMRLFDRLERSQEKKDRKRWIKQFAILSAQMTGHKVRGIRLKYRQPCDLPLVACLLKALILTDSLESCSLSSCCPNVP